MKVLHIYKTYYPDTFGGVEQVISTITSSLVSRGVHQEIVVLSSAISSYEKKIDRHGVVVHRFPTSINISSCPMSFKLLLEFRQLARGFDVLHYHFPWPFADVLSLLLFPRKLSLITYHSDIVKQKLLSRLYAPLRHYFFRKTDCIAATSPGYLFSSKVLSNYEGKCEVVPLGLPDLSAQSYFGSADFQKLGKFFLFVGVFRYYKGIDYLIEAARHVKANIVLIGDGGLRSKYQQRCLELELDNVVFLGAVEDEVKFRALAECYAFVFPSHLRSEAFGLGLIEAARFGKPMISCEIGTGTSFVNLDGETGIVIPPADVVALSGAMQRLLDDERIAVRMGKAARERYLTLFTSEEMADAYYKIYKRLVN